MKEKEMAEIAREEKEEKKDENEYSEIDENEYLNVLRPLLKSKRRTVKAQSDYEENMKLVKFALGRGFTPDIIRQCLDYDGDE